MGKCISLGEYNTNYKYMFLYLISRALNDLVYGLNYEDLYEPIILFGNDTKKFINLHELINTIFCYLGIIIFSLIIIKCDSYDKNKNSNKETTFLSRNSIHLIHNNPLDDLNYNACRIFLSVFIVTFLWVIQDLLMYIFKINKLNIIEFWTFKMLLVYLIGKKMFNIQIYRHQIFAICIITIVCSLLLFSSFSISIINDNNNIYITNIYLIPIVIIIILFFLLLESFSNWDAKWLMDLKFISLSKLYLLYGILGFIIYSIICIIATFVDCGEQPLELCPVKNDRKYYFESFIIYFNDFSLNIFILIILNVITYIMKSYFYILTIKKLTPFHVISMPTIYYFYLHIVLLIYSIVKTEELKKNPLIYILEISAYFLAFLAFSIFLELIEFNFCLCNYDLRKNITRRSIRESNINSEFDESMIFEEVESEINDKDVSQCELSSK